MNNEILAESETSSCGYRPVEVLLVEDNLSDAILIRESLKDTRMSMKLHHVADGIECMAFLRNEGDYGETPTPDLVLLDLRMPRMDGHEVLAALMEDEALHHLPVVVLSASSEEEDILQAYQLRCSSYVVKPMDFDHFRQKIRAIGNYWLSLAALPCAS